jgi:Tfp pilus assembly protein PilN
MVTLLAQSFHTRGELRDYAAELSVKLESTKMQVTEATRLRHQCAVLEKQLAVHRQLHKPISYSEVTGTLASLMPPTVSLVDVQLNTERLTTTRVVAARNPNAGGRDSTVTESSWVISLDLQGVAPSDQDIANFIGALASSNLFQNVKMIYSKQGTRGRLITREFRMRMQVPLNCEYRNLNQPQQEVAGAH